MSTTSHQAMYRNRFGDSPEFRDGMWRILGRWFQRDIPDNAVVLEMAAGYCEFINHIRAARRIAVDINPDTARHAAPGVEVVLSPAARIEPLADASVDVVFMSNFLEHLERPVIVDVLKEARRLLRPSGRLLILQPNYRYIGKDYWMFFDHITPVDDRALCEILSALDFRVVRIIPRFLPYTTKSRLPKRLAFVEWYLRLPLLWRIFGGQAYVVAEK